LVLIIIIIIIIIIIMKEVGPGVNLSVAHPHFMLMTLDHGRYHPVSYLKSEVLKYTNYIIFVCLWNLLSET
jgi:hypothetical protein